MTIQYNLEGQQKAYEKWAPFYDKVYRRLLADAQRRSAEIAAACGNDILEVGVGTGLVLRYYPASARVVGVDLSTPMLRKAQEKRLPQVRGLACMDACRLGFADATFDAVNVPFVITLVPDPEAALTEIARVLKPGGEIVIASKYGAEGGFQAKVEEMAAPLAKRVGWSTSFRVSRVRRWAETHGGVEFVGVQPAFPLGYFKILRMRKARLA
ncbi:MAG: SAM-dependent methyltransferase [Rhizobiales bacterium 65-9]|nr:class I SAM-dependent methyltransferase [Hyphomicrobiales bacterium]OJY39241.1 MAG: SAM-dependent methyltransferase [Rhizobiales bacterium 65-9]